jgi:hypothetical protein
VRLDRPAMASFAADVAELAADLRCSVDTGESPSYQPFDKYLASLDAQRVLRTIRYLTHIIRPALHGNGAGPTLEVGSGYGFNLLYLTYLGVPSCHGIEAVPSICEQSRKVHEAAAASLNLDLSECKIYEGDAQSSPFQSGVYRRVIAIEMFAYTLAGSAFPRNK